ncbi:uncharacterized protein ACA1_089070 [Acanthamoeba castellanii str. Neff]|uniref:EGF-like domain-containing protein n=1 Tax=Acanthamoeba castellanii (strain ATCC 30010 / Neff) TaxID=1257118 RepID=L8GUJ2_ACACF|nr:uncharacterized protein ACA1_089070 [Acanthamoeba castellanii str. Neff]ELR16660.1 hypothetical protein ACA1_089070 [Acanthamoeba castellanii str. Neff]
MGYNKVSVLLVLWALAAVVVVHVAAATGGEAESLLGGDGGGGRCNSTAECNDHGHCVASTAAGLQQDFLNSNATGVCHCNSRYAGKWCEHKRKNKLEAFLLSILIGSTGADRFYLGFIGLLLNVLACVPACIGSCLGTCCGFARTEYVGIGDDYGEGLTCSSLFSIGGSCLTCCMSLGSLAWWLTDWILILKGSLYDNM